MALSTFSRLSFSPLNGHALRYHYLTLPISSACLYVLPIWLDMNVIMNLRAQAKKFLQERSPLYMTARSVLQDLRRHLEPLVPLEIPPRPLRNEQDRAMVVNWRKYIKWEESNPLDIEDIPTLQSRIGYAYRKCLTQMRFYPELWYVHELDFLADFASPCRPTPFDTYLCFALPRLMVS